MQLYLPLLLFFIEIVSAKCTHDNCARAVMGVQQGIDHHSIASSDCSSFLRTTLTPPASTVSITFTSTVNATTTFEPAKRQTTATIPDYASNCLDAAAYASACFCFGVKPVTITAQVSATTVTVTATTTNVTIITIPSTIPTSSFTYCSNSSLSSSASPTISISPNCTTNTYTDSQNCGTCSNVCPSGVCENGVSTTSQCQAQTCGGFTNCSGNPTCFCFTSTRNDTDNGFCGQNAVCSGLTPCTNDFDCAGRNSTGDICAIKTCCSAPSTAQPGVCLKGVCGDPAANLKMAVIARGFIGGTAAGRRH